MARLRRAAPARDQPGFSLFELVVVIVLVALLYAFAADRLIVMRAQAERTEVETTVGAMRSAAGIRVAAHIAKGRANEIRALAGSNPMDLLSERPESYKGSFFGPDPASFEGGQWYFDKRDGSLVYRVRFADFFQSEQEGPARLRFALRLDYTDRNANGRFDEGVDEIHGMRLLEMERYTWLERPKSG